MSADAGSTKRASAPLKIASSLPRIIPESHIVPWYNSRARLRDAECGAPVSRVNSQPYSQPVADRSLIACLHCDLLQRIPQLEPGASARCPRCNKELWRHREDSLNRTLALTLAAAVLYVVANSVPMLGLTIVGRDASTTVIGGAQHLWNNGQKIVGVLVLFTAVIAPALQIGLMLAIVLGGMRQRAPRWVGALLRHHPTTRIWSMIEVMMVGVLVALVKIADYATVIPGVALFVLWVLVFILAGMSASFDSRDVWERIRWADEEQRDAGNSLAEERS
jgi:paraquat-inducible protein A